MKRVFAVVTPAVKDGRRVPRRNVSTTLEDVAQVGKVNIHFYSAPCSQFQLTYHELESFSCETADWMLDLLWEVSWPLRSSRPAWMGFMQDVSHEEHPGVASITFFPMIDLNPSDMTCVYSTLCLICSQASKYEVTPVVTFDQPLWWKAQIVVANEPAGSDLKSLVLRLGAFHAQMSFLGCIVILMSGSRLHRVLEVVYASNTVGHMLNGSLCKSFAWALFS